MLSETIDLHMNEMPYPPPEHVLEAAREALTKLNRYADPEEMGRLRELLAQYAGVPPRYLVLSPGSDLLLREIIHTFSQGRKVVTVSPSFFPTVQAVKQFAPRRLSMRLSPPTFDLERDLMMDALDEPSLLIVDNPNNPTGRMLLDRRMVEAIAERRDVFFVIDEAYYEFSGTTFADMVADCPRLAIIRTMDKAFSLAGARIGYAIAGEVFLDAISDFYPFLPRPSLYAAMAALRNSGYMRENVRQIVEERERLQQALCEGDEGDLLGTRVYPSNTNFLLVRTKVPDVARRLREAGVLVSDMSRQLPPGFIRVSVGTPEENDAFLAAYKSLLIQ
ncbi:MAG: aminotransferase class I/II-fold pyridoxal phosphate-dependent enzyme [Chloroflexota bacterium]|nr:aminotransferase class I/II-fold pyridoxal phosphate-dependent enzyme [Chloroflexota bacterium]